MKESREVLISCSRCQSQYSVSEIMLASRRLVRCSVCGHIWHEGPAKCISNISDINRKPSRCKRIFMWLLSISFFAALVGGGILFWLFFNELGK